VWRREPDLLKEIARGAQDDRVPLPALLRKCITLGGQTGSEALRSWASLELKGYNQGDELPDYRTGAAPLMLDGATFSAQVSGQLVSAEMIPDFARDKVSDDIEFRQPISEIIDLMHKAERDERGIARLIPPGMPYLLPLINSELQGAHIERMYWGVSSTVLARVVDIVRTNLVELVAEMRAGTPRGRSVPSREVAEQAVSVVVGGKRNRVVVIGHANDVTTAMGGHVSTGAAVPESKPRRAMWWVGALAGLVGAAATLWTLILIL